MNKQEAIEKIKSKKIPYNSISNYGLGYNAALDMAICIINQIDEPEKPVVPQFVADWYEANKEGFENNVYDLCVQFNNDNEELNREVRSWFNYPINKPFETLVKMKLFGYEVDKEKLYRVELPNPNGDSNRYGLCKVDGRIIIGSFVFGLNKAINTKLTEAEIKKDFEWAWQFAEEVKND